MHPYSCSVRILTGMSRAEMQLKNLVLVSKYLQVRAERHIYMPPRTSELHPGIRRGFGGVLFYILRTVNSEAAASANSIMLLRTLAASNGPSTASFEGLKPILWYDLDPRLLMITMANTCVRVGVGKRCSHSACRAHCEQRGRVFATQRFQEARTRL